jgi:hypothetical protein
MTWRRLPPWTMGLWSRSGPPGRAQCPFTGAVLQPHFVRACLETPWHRQASQAHWTQPPIMLNLNKRFKHHTQRVAHPSSRHDVREPVMSTVALIPASLIRAPMVA